MKTDKINSEIVKTKEKISEYQARLRDLEKQKTEQENLEILQAVRSIAVSPEDVKALLNQIKTAKYPNIKNAKEIVQHEND